MVRRCLNFAFIEPTRQFEKCIPIWIYREVDGCDLEAWLSRQIAAIGTNPKVLKLNLPDELEAYKTARAALQAWIDGISDWTFPVNFTEYRTSFNDLHDTYMKTVGNITRHRRALEQTKEVSKLARQEGARVYRTNRDRIRTYVVGKGTPDLVAKLVADRLYSVLVPPESRGIMSIKFVNCLEGLPANAEISTLDQPIHFKYDAKDLEENLCEYGVQCAQMYRVNQETAVSKMREASQAMSAVQPQRLTSVCAIDVAPSFDFNPLWSKDAKWFDYCAPRQALWTSWTEQCVVDPSNWPFRHFPGLLTQYVGQSVIIIVDSASILDAGGEVTAWLNMQGTNPLEKFPSVILGEGSSLWLPLGSYPIIVGNSMPLRNIKETVDLKERVVGIQRHSMALGFTPVFDAKKVQDASPELRRMIASFYLRGAPTLPPSWRANDGEATKWNAALQPQ